jgi:hypothetical protein
MAWANYCASWNPYLLFNQAKRNKLSAYLIKTTVDSLLADH